jgi:hypothetical protein
LRAAFHAKSFDVEAAFVTFEPAELRLPSRLAMALCGFACAATAASGQSPPPPQPAAQAQGAPATRVFASDAGIVLNFVKPDKTADFEAVVGKLKEALARSTKPERQQQAASWKVFKSPEAAAGGSVLYVFVMDPAVKGADYTVTNILAEAFAPADVEELYRQYAGAFAPGQNFVNLTLIADMAK